ncbi:tol-pal system protein YbgF [Variibacter gotjawalensis]|nr:tol-pal system protein YbgF [Variibacter gotjawalensis]NIK47496.1 tol-pal system protein YbgF [Variibacter gotjawalensis]
MKRIALPLIALMLTASAAFAQYQDDPRYQQRSGGGFFDNLFGGSERMRGGENQRQPAGQPQQQQRRYEQGRYNEQGADDGELAVQVDKLRAKVRQLTGQVEELEYRNRQLEEQLQARGGSAPPRAEAPSAPRNVQSGSQLPPPDEPGSPAPPLRQHSSNVPSTGSVAGGRGRNDTFDPDADPNAPGVPKPLGSPESRAPAPVASAEPVGPRGGRERGEPLAIGNQPGEPAPVAQPVREARTIAGPLPAPPTRSPNSTGAQPVSAPATDTPRDQFANAQAQMQRREYAQAESSLRDFLKKYPSDRLSGDAHYQLGESLYQRQNYRDAAESFLTVTTKYNKIGRAPDALMRLGQSLAALGEKDAACATLGEVNRKYPNASAGVKQTVERERTRVQCS